MTRQAATPIYDVPAFALNTAFESLRAALETDAFDRGTRERILAGFIGLMDREVQEIARRKEEMAQSVMEKSRALETEDNAILTEQVEDLRKGIDQHAKGVIECERLRDFMAQRYERTYFTPWFLVEKSNQDDQPRPCAPEWNAPNDSLEDDGAEPDGPLVEYER